MNSRNSGFIAVESLAMALLVILVIVVVAVLSINSKGNDSLDSSRNKTADVNSRLDELQKKDKYALENSPQNPLSDSFYKDVPFNERLFNESRLQGDTYGTTASRMQAKIVSVSQTPDLHLNLIAITPSLKGRKMEYVYNVDVLPKIKVSYGTVNDLKPGDEINIDETNDFGQTYQKSIVTVEISKISGN